MRAAYLLPPAAITRVRRAMASVTGTESRSASASPAAVASRALADRASSSRSRVGKCRYKVARATPAAAATSVRLGGPPPAAGRAAAAAGAAPANRPGGGPAGGRGGLGEAGRLAVGGEQVGGGVEDGLGDPVVDSCAPGHRPDFTSLTHWYTLAFTYETLMSHNKRSTRLN